MKHFPLFVLFSADRYLAFVQLLTYIHQPVYRFFQFTQQSFLPFAEILQQLFGIQNKLSAFRSVSIRALSLYDILPRTKVIGLTAIMT